MRRHTARFCAGLKACQCCTSSKLRPQPLHSASPCEVEQMAMHGASGVDAYQASQAACAAAGIVGLVAIVLVVVDHQRIHLGQRQHLVAGAQAVGRGRTLRATS